MTFTINVPVFPMRKEIAARKARKGSCFPFSFPSFTKSDTRRTRDAEGFLELELLPPEDLKAMRRPLARKHRKQSM